MRRKLVTSGGNAGGLDKPVASDHCLAFCGAAPADRASSLAAVRFVFTAYVLLIAVGLAFYIAIGITNHQ
jgi:hypothetical protein